MLDPIRLAVDDSGDLCSLDMSMTCLVDDVSGHLSSFPFVTVLNLLFGNKLRLFEEL